MTREALVLEEFIFMMENIVAECRKVDDEINDCEKLVEDLRHILECAETSYKDRAKLATQLMKVLRRRRVAKNRREVLQPVLDAFNKTHNFLPAFKWAARKIDSITQGQGDRAYIFRTENKMIVDGKVCDRNG